MPGRFALPCRGALPPWGILSHLFRALVPLALLVTASGLLPGCRQHEVCDEVQGSCMALRIEGRGSYPRLGVELDVEPAQGSASRRTGLAPEAVTLPTRMRVLPPPAVLASEVRRVRAYVLDDSGTEAASAAMEVSWPEGAHISVTLYLVDGGADLGPGSVDMGVPDLAPVPSVQCTADATRGVSRRERGLLVQRGNSGETRGHAPSTALSNSNDGAVVGGF